MTLPSPRYSKGRGSTTNPGEVWVEACVLTPMNAVKASHKTGTRRASLAPVFNQKFIFKVRERWIYEVKCKRSAHARVLLARAHVCVYTVDLWISLLIDRHMCMYVIT